MGSLPEGTYFYQLGDEVRKMVGSPRYIQILEMEQGADLAEKTFLEYQVLISANGFGAVDTVVSLDDSQTNDLDFSLVDLQLDMMTPEYYLSGPEDLFYLAANEIRLRAHAVDLHHPLEGGSGFIPEYSVTREFGVGVGPGGTGEHHAAVDMHVGQGEILVPVYAAHDGRASSSF